MHKYLTSLLLILLLFALTSATVVVQSQAEDDRPETGQPEPVVSADEAFNKAMQYVGFAKDSSMQRQAESDYMVSTVILSDTGTDFSKSHIDGKVAWQITLPSMDIDVGVSESVRSEYGPKKYAISIDSATGDLLEITGVTLQTDREPPKRPPWNEAARQMVFSSEHFEGFPPVLPAITFADALTKMRGLPSIAYSISAIYVMYSQQDAEPRPAWVIYVDGLPNLKADPCGNTERFPLTNWRSVIDAQTGEVLSSCAYALDPELLE